jgi:Tfp pilus assembly protein PilF
MNLRLFNFKRAEDIYKGVLQDRPVLWAKLGLGKTKVAQKEFADAERNLKEVIAEDKRVVEAHDLLADSYRGRGDNIAAQEAMQAAAEISPKSVMRQRRLAELAKLNEDTQACLEASRKVIKTARNSCYESANDYFNLARELSDLSKQTETGNEKYAKESFDVLQRLEKRPYFDEGADLQANAIRSRTMVNQNKLADAEEFLGKAKDIYEAKKDQLKPEASLELAQSLMAKGDKAAADQLLSELVSKFPHDENLAARVDAISDVPKSAAGRKKVADMTKSGIDSYDKKNFAEAIGIFKNAIGIFPSHIGLNLNLVQAVLAEAKANGEKAGFEKLCRSSLDRISTIAESDPQYARYVHLREQMEAQFKLDLDGLDIEL